LSISCQISWKYKTYFRTNYYSPTLTANQLGPLQLVLNYAAGTVTDDSNFHHRIPGSLVHEKSGHAVCDELKHYYNPAAFLYLRRRLKSFPSTSTIHLWLSKFDGQPDFTQQSFDTIVYFAEGNGAWEDL
jgi:hypothetical protein